MTPALVQESPFTSVLIRLTISDRGQPEVLFPGSENLMVDVEVTVLMNEFTYASLLSVT
jgi:hypothetical protein